MTSVPLLFVFPYFIVFRSDPPVSFPFTLFSFLIFIFSELLNTYIPIYVLFSFLIFIPFSGSVFEIFPSSSPPSARINSFTLFRCHFCPLYLIPPPKKNFLYFSVCDVLLAVILWYNCIKYHLEKHKCLLLNSDPVQILCLLRIRIISPVAPFRYAFCDIYDIF